MTAATACVPRGFWIKGTASTGQQKLPMTLPGISQGSPAGKGAGFVGITL